jgi:hypothetical protein
MDSRFAGACRSAFSSLMLVSLAVPHQNVRAPTMLAPVSSVRMAAVRPSARLSVEQLIAAVNNRGGDDSTGANVAEVLGLAHRAFPVKEIDITQGPDSREIAVGAVDNQTYLLMDHRRPNDVWMFRISKSGVIQKAIYGLTHQGFHDAPADKAASQATEEEQLWSDWLANGANGASGGKGGSKN